MTLWDDVMEHEEEQRRQLGIWCGGTTPSLLGLLDYLHRRGWDGLVYSIEGDTPFEDRIALISANFCRAIEFRQHWYGGPASGDWWWQAVAVVNYTRNLPWKEYTPEK